MKQTAGFRHALVLAVKDLRAYRRLLMPTLLTFSQSIQPLNPVQSRRCVTVNRVSSSRSAWTGEVLSDGKNSLENS